MNNVVLPVVQWATGFSNHKNLYRHILSALPMGKILKAITPSSTSDDELADKNDNKKGSSKDETSGVLLDKTTLFRIVLWVAMQTIAYSTPIGPLKTAFTVAKFTWSSFGTIKYAYRLARAGLGVIGLVTPKARGTEKKREDNNTLSSLHLCNKPQDPPPRVTVTGGWTLVESHPGALVKTNEPTLINKNGCQQDGQPRCTLIENYVPVQQKQQEQQEKEGSQQLSKSKPSSNLRIALSTAPMDLSSTFIDAF